MKNSRLIWSAFASAIAIAATCLPASAQLPKTPAATGTQLPQTTAAKPNIVFIMGDDIGWMQPSIYHQGLDGRRDTQHRPYRARGCEVHDLLRRAKLHGGAHRLLYRHDAAARRHDPAATARQPVLPAARHAVAGQVPARPRLQHRRVRQEPSGRPLGGAADGARLPGVLGLPLPPRRNAGRELPRHQQVPDRAGHRAAVQEHAGARPQRSRGRGGCERPRCA